MIIILFMGPGWVSFAKAEKGGKGLPLGAWGGVLGWLELQSNVGVL